MKNICFQSTKFTTEITFIVKYQISKSLGPHSLNCGRVKNNIGLLR